MGNKIYYRIFAAQKQQLWYQKSSISFIAERDTECQN